MTQKNLEETKKTVLHDSHAALGAKMVEFNGWLMPIQYKGIIHEHHTVREKVGIFDVSHMGRIQVDGPDAERFLDHLTTNKIVDKDNGTATYSVLTNSQGGCVDDIIIYKEDSIHFFVIVNAGNRNKDLQHFKNESKNFQVIIKDRYNQDGILAVQGPYAKKLLEELFPESSELKPFHFINVKYNGIPIIISSTGYTGAGGCEIYAPNDCILDLWNSLLEYGQKYGIEPIGLGARDTLRLEMGYALYGHELSDTISPIESVSHWTVKPNKNSFIGKDQITALANSNKKRSQYGIILNDKGIAREGYKVLKNGKEIGIVTSGTHSPTLGKALAIIMTSSPLQEGDSVDIAIRDNTCNATVTHLPFIKN